MLDLLYGHDAEVAAWVQANLRDQAFSNFSAIGVLDDGVLIAGVVYSNWLPSAGVIEMSAYAATPRWFNRTVLGAILKWPFEGLGCQMVVLRVSERNERMCRLAEGVGFDKHTIPRLLGRDTACNIYTLTTEAWAGNKLKRASHGQ